MLSTVVLPEPEGPTMARNSPGADVERQVLEGDEGLVALAEGLADGVEADVLRGHARLQGKARASRARRLRSRIMATRPTAIMQTTMPESWIE